MNLAQNLRRARCAGCEWQQVWGIEEILDGLRELGMLRREKQASAETILHLADDASDRLRCPQCKRTGLIEVRKHH